MGWKTLIMIFILLSLLISIPVISANDCENIDENNTDITEQNDLIVDYDNSKDINIVDDENIENQQNSSDLNIIRKNMTNSIQNTKSLMPVIQINNYKFWTSDLTKYYGSDSRFIIRITNSNNVGISGLGVIFLVNGNQYSRTTDSSGYASIAINLNSGNYIMTTNFTDFPTIILRNNIHILSTISGQNIVKYYKNDTQYLATFRDTSGNLLTNTAVTFNINGVVYTRTTNNNGIAQLNINLNPGTYIITATNPVSNEQHSNTITVLPTLTASDLVMNYGDGSQFKAYLVNGQGNPYPGQTVQFNINGVFYNRVTNSNGIASLNINLSPGTYIITSSNNGLSISNHIYVN